MYVYTIQPYLTSNVHDLKEVMKSQVEEATFELTVRSHLLEDCIRGAQKRLFSPDKSVVVSRLHATKFNMHKMLLHVINYCLGALCW